VYRLHTSTTQESKLYTTKWHEKKYGDKTGYITYANTKFSAAKQNARPIYHTPNPYSMVDTNLTTSKSDERHRWHSYNQRRKI